MWQQINKTQQLQERYKLTIYLMVLGVRVYQSAALAQSQGIIGTTLLLGVPWVGVFPRFPRF